MNHFKFLTWVRNGGILSVLLLTTACQTTSINTATSSAASPTAAPATTADGNGVSLKLGSLLPQTGDLAQFGGPMQDSVNLLVETVNACGASVELISEDDQTDPAAGAAGMTKLAEVDQVGGVVGAAGSAVSKAALDIAVRNQVVQISPSSTSPTFTQEAKQGLFKGFWFRTAPPDTFQGDALAQLADQEGFDTVSVLAINNDYGNGLVGAFIPAFEALGGTVPNEANPTKFAPDATTFDSEVRAAFEGQPDAVLLVAYPETGSLILKSAQEQGLLSGNTRVIMTDGMKAANLAELVGRTPDGKFITAGMIGTAPAAGGPGLQAFTDLYQSRFNREIGPYTANSWDAAALLVLAAEAANSPTGAAIKDYVRTVSNAPGEEVTDICQALTMVREGKDINFQGASGTLDFDAQGDVVGSYDVWAIGEDGTLSVKSRIDVGGGS